MKKTPFRHGPLRNADRIWHLSQAGLVAGLSKDDLAAIDGMCSDRVYPPGSAIFFEGEPADNLYILNRGVVRTSLGKSASREKVLNLLKGGEVFGEEVLGHPALRQVSATAHRECWVSLLPANQLLELIDARPLVGLNFTRILTRKLLEARSDLRDLSSMDASQRVAKTLLKLGRQHGIRVLSRTHAWKLKFPISHRHLSGLIGANRPHISTIMSEFKKRGYLDYEGRRLILEVEELKRFLDGARSEGKVRDPKQECAC